MIDQHVEVRTCRSFVVAISMFVLGKCERPVDPANVGRSGSRMWVGGVECKVFVHGCKCQSAWLPPLGERPFRMVVSVACANERLKKYSYLSTNEP